MPDATSIQASSIGDLTAASRDIRERAVTLHKTAGTDLRKIRYWLCLHQPKTVLEQYFMLGNHSRAVGEVSRDMRGTENLTAGGLTDVKNT
jgi:hypothetical protein